MRSFVRRGLGFLLLIGVTVGVPNGASLEAGSPNARCVAAPGDPAVGEVVLGDTVIFRFRSEAGGYEPLTRCAMVTERLNRFLREGIPDVRPGVVGGEVVVLAGDQVAATVTEAAAVANGTSRSMLAWIWANQLREALGAKQLAADRVPFRGIPGMQEMTASWYGSEFAGNATASGERFNPNDFTAAHRSLPFGTRLWVVEPRTGNQVVVRINDRGPWTQGRDLDLSYAAARELGIVSTGVQSVWVEVLDTEWASR